MSRPACPRCGAMAARIAELEASVEAWRAHWRDAATAETDAQTLSLWAEGLGLSPGQAMMVRVLADRAGRVVTFDALHDASRAVPTLCRGEDLADPRRTIQVRMHQVRRRLAARGLDVGIRNVWGLGYRLSVEGAAVLRAAVTADFPASSHPQERHP